MMTTSYSGLGAGSRQARVHHVADARHRERGLGHVGREHDPPRAVRREDAVLLGRPQAGEERQHLDAGRLAPFEALLHVANLALPGQEDEHVAGASVGRPELVDGVADGLAEAVVAGFLERECCLELRIL